MSVAALAMRPAPWLVSPGLTEGIVISSRVRLARTMAGRAFHRALPLARQEELVSELISALGEAVPTGMTVRTDALDSVARECLVERQLISRDLAGAKRPGAVRLSADEQVAAMVNEEDHLRLQVIRPGLCLEECLDRAVAVDRQLERRIPWAVHPGFGYLTACHTNLGTGMRASVMLHLPALAETEELKSVLRGCSLLHLVVRGQHGEGSDAAGHFYQVSNMRSLGQDEDAIAQSVIEAAERIVAAERAARSALLSKARPRLEDRVWRAWGLLSHARVLSTDELQDGIGWLRLGLALGVLPELKWSILDRCLIQCQPAHLQLLHPGDGLDDAGRRDRRRADLVRALLTNRQPPA